MVQRVITGAGAMAVSPHNLASRAAVDVMNEGGSAVDGAIAANAVIGVVRPTDCGIGGDLFALILEPGRRAPAVLNASGRAGSGVSAADMRGSGHVQMPDRHPATVTVPGCVNGWLVLSERFGKLPLANVLAPAIGLASDGFPVSLEMSWNLAEIAQLVADQDSVAELYPTGEVPRAGAVLTRPSLADVLRRIGTEGRPAFYEGEVAVAIAEATRFLITPDDLASNQPDWVEPLGMELLAGHTAWTVPPNSQGYVTLATLWLMERAGGSSDFDDPEYHHLLIECYRAAVWDRDHLLADPDHMNLTPSELLNEDRLFRLLGRIRSDEIADWPAPQRVPGGTAYMCTVDADGMGVSLMQSNFAGIGSGLSAGATGVWLQNRGAGFTLEDGQPNMLAPGKRPLHTLAPSLWTQADRLSMLLGTRGGHLQPQLVAQLAAQQLLVGFSPAETQAAPRWALDDFGPGRGSAPVLEKEIPAQVVDGLTERGHNVTLIERQRDWGPAAIIRVLEDGTRDGAADPRVSTASVAVGGG